MKKKVFSIGTHNGVPFDLEKIKNILSNTKEKVRGIFDHTSVYMKDKEVAPEIAEFSNLRLEGNDVFADLEFNDDGKTYEKNKSLKGISVEINRLTNSITAIALLPRRVNPSVKGALLDAEFDEKENVYTDVIEFEEIIEEGGKMTAEELQKAIVELPLEDRLAMIVVIGKSVTMEEKKAFRAIQYEFAEQTGITVEEFAKEKGIEIEIKEAKVAKTEDEIRAEITAEFEAKETAKSELQEFEEVLKTKVLPAHQEAYRMAFVASQDNSELLEFEEGKGKMTGKEHLLGKVKAMGDISLTDEFAKLEGSIEFSESKKRLDSIDKTSQEISKMYGGK